MLFFFVESSFRDYILPIKKKKLYVRGVLITKIVHISNVNGQWFDQYQK